MVLSKLKKKVKMKRKKYPNHSLRADVSYFLLLHAEKQRKCSATGYPNQGFREYSGILILEPSIFRTADFFEPTSVSLGGSKNRDSTEFE